MADAERNGKGEIEKKLESFIEDAFRSNNLDPEND